MKLCYIDLEQAESRAVGAYCFTTLGEDSYLTATECGDLHTLVCSMCWTDLPWPEEFNLDAVRKYGTLPPDLISAAKKVAKQPAYRDKSYRDLAKVLGHGCLTADHEVLTPNGWVSIATMPSDIPILAWNPKSNRLSWEIPLAWTHKQSEVYLVSGFGIRLLASPEHRIPLGHGETTVAELANTHNQLVPYLPRVEWERAQKEGTVTPAYQPVEQLSAQLFRGVHEVFCPTVPSSGFVVRYKGIVQLSLNSNYRGKPPTMSKHSHVDVKLVRSFQRAYFEAFPEIPRWHRWIAEQIQTKRYLVTLAGRRRYFFTRPDDDKTLREATAYLPQSFATGDYTNLGLLKLWKLNLPIWIFAQVHDAVAFAYDEQDEHWIIDYICKVLETEMELRAPDGTSRKFSIPTEALVGWNLAYRKDSNPDGLIVWKGKDDRQRRQKIQNDFGSVLQLPPTALHT